MPTDISGENNKFELLKSRLSDKEQGSLYTFCKNPDMVHAVEKALMYHYSEMGVIKDTDVKIHDVNWVYGVCGVQLNNEQVGALVRAKIEGLTFMFDAWKEIKKFGEDTVKTLAEKNPAL